MRSETRRCWCSLAFLALQWTLSLFALLSSSCLSVRAAIAASARSDRHCPTALAAAFTHSTDRPFVSILTQVLRAAHPRWLRGFGLILAFFVGAVLLAVVCFYCHRWLTRCWWPQNGVGRILPEPPEHSPSPPPGGAAAV
jgi:hypothetical protein